MKAELKNMWLEALQSGKYKKGRIALRTKTTQEEKDQYCCLGVLCDIVDPTGWVEVQDNYSLIPYTCDGPLIPYTCDGKRVSTSSLDNKMLEKVGLKNSQQNRLIALNDDYATWDAVIEYIEAEV